ncbi:MAG: RluA family pseudouridine synthase [Vicingus serpentipes]|nr:RluA family pseudouridine synthase [Vicingus serpentipes]
MSKKFNKPNAFRNRKSTFKVNEEETTLLPFLIIAIKDKTRNKIKSLLTHKQITVNGKITSLHSTPLKKGDEVSVSWDRPFKKISYQGLSVVFEDEDIIVINKRSGFLSIGSKKERKQTVYQVLTSHIQQENPTARLFVVHRLDREASGLMVFAKNKAAQVELEDTWAKTLQQRKYLIITEGTIEKDEDTISSFLVESKALIMHSSPNPKNGKKAITHYKVIKKNEFYTMLEAWQETERKNQVRVHLQSIGHPVLGDKKYGSNENPISRTALHAIKLVFQHPATHKEVTFETKVPEDFLKIFRYKFYES